MQAFLADYECEEGVNVPVLEVGAGDWVEGGLGVISEGLGCQGHSTLSSQCVFEGAQLTQLVQLVTAGRLFPCHKGRVDP